MLSRQEEKRTATLKALFAGIQERHADFDKRYRPHVYPLVRPQPQADDISTWCATTFDEVIDGDARRAEVITWLEANSESYEVLKSHHLVGFADPVEAFWFKMRWG